MSSPEPSYRPEDPGADGFVQRAALLADLGRYEDAAAELQQAIAAYPRNVPALTMLARVRLAGGEPAKALAAADAAVGTDPEHGDAIVVRGLALVDLRRFTESARVAEQLIRYENDAYAQRHGAAILSASRNGQRALEAAWRGVRLAPEEPQAHLVLGLVSARLELFDLAERAYREALRLEPGIADVADDVGLVTLEERRYAVELEYLAEAAAIRGGRSGFERIAGRPVPAALRSLLIYGAAGALTATFVAAWLRVDGFGSVGISRGFALLAAAVGPVLAVRFARRLPGTVAATLTPILRADRPLAVAAYATAATPVLLALYALFDSPWPLVAVAVCASVGELLALLAFGRAPAAPASGP